MTAVLSKSKPNCCIVCRIKVVNKVDGVRDMNEGRREHHSSIILTSTFNYIETIHIKGNITMRHNCSHHSAINVNFIYMKIDEFIAFQFGETFYVILRKYCCLFCVHDLF